MLVQLRNSSLNCYRLERLESKYTLLILSCKSLGVAISATRQEKEILKSEATTKPEAMNIIHVEVK